MNGKSDGLGLSTEKILRPNEGGRCRLFEGGSTALFLIDNANGRILGANRTASGMYGYAREELLKLRAMDLSTDSEFGRQEARNESRETATGYHRKKDGSIFPVEITTSRFQWKDGNVHIAAVREIGLPLQFEEELKESGQISKTLFDRKQTPVELPVATAGNDVSECRQLQADREKMESIRNLAGGIAHDFKNIITPIIGLSELLLESLASDSQQYQDVSGILKAANRGRELVENILAFSRQSKPELAPVRIQKILEEAVRLGRSTVQPSIEIIQNIQNDCGRVMANPFQIQQLALNLITNACHAVEPTGGKISVEFREEELGNNVPADNSLKPGKYAMLSVSDNGPGIPPAILAKIFEPYFTTKEKRKGTGLGLAVVYGIVKQHQGEIKVSSKIGKGSTFQVYLPLLEASSEKSMKENADPYKIGTEPIVTGR